MTFTRDGVNLTADGTLLMFEHLQRSSVSRLDVTNEFGSYAFVYDAAKDDFYLEGNPSIPYSEMSLISLMSDAGYAIVNRRVEDHCTDFSLYGLDDASVSASYTLTTLQGDTHTVLIGAQVPGSSYRYVRYAGRDAVYIARSSYAGTVMANVTSFVSPILATAMSTDDYYKVDDFYLKRNGETVTAIRYLDEAAREQKSTIYEMTVPAAYTVNDTACPRWISPATETQCPMRFCKSTASVKVSMYMCFTMYTEKRKTSCISARKTRTVPTTAILRASASWRSARA